jgi:exosome complex component RRP42
MNNVQKQYLMGLINNGKRDSGRGIHDYRKISIETGLIYKAEGSARARIGNTDVIVGVKMDVGSPFSDRPDEGVLMVNAEFSPMASANFEPGRPSEECIELARVVDRGIRESKAVDVKKLCIEKGEKVWMVFVDIQIMNHDGNLIDASGLAAIAALASASIPEYDKKTEKLVMGTKAKKLPLTCKPVPVTLYKVGENLIVDPTVEEESFVETRLTVSTKDNGNLCALQKGGSTSLSLDEIYKAFDISIKKGKELRKLIKG